MGIYSKKYDVIIIGAGHAGCEAALAAARMGCDVLLFSIYLDTIAHMPCSPSIGGVGKGQLVKEIDALGGEMGKVADLTGIQFRTLNTSKGPAVQSTRTQNDKVLYRNLMKSILEKEPRIDLKQTLVEEILIEGDRIKGIRDHIGMEFQAEAVVITAGTFLHGLVHIGTKQTPSGRAGEFAAERLADNLRTLGFEMGRMKTGTPARLRRSTIDFSQFLENKGDDNPRPFSLTTREIRLPQVSCFIGHTSPQTHSIIHKHINLSPLYSGQIKGISARYCPSLEDKVVKFSERERHQIILEPEGLETEEIYASGTGNSLPYEIQIEIVRSIRGLENAEVMRPAYAIEYDFIFPTQLRPTLETKLLKGLYMAGQVNGTSGYEEAAAQGMWAGINAALAVQKSPPFILDRSEAYMGVMIDDLTTRGTREPYRMFTSRAEYRLLLREDNADLRLLEKGYHLGLHSKERLEELEDKQRRISLETKRLESVRVKPVAANPVLERKDLPPIEDSLVLAQLLKRPELCYADIEAIEGVSSTLPIDIRNQVEIQVKYEGYLKRQESEVVRFKRLEKTEIPPGFDYSKLPGLSNELKQKLLQIQPLSLGQASRIEGITPAALSVLMLHLKKSKIRKTESGAV
jgi:tRNA uridine 5-carboxymethylaminomethyl modification enzyme